MPPPEQGLLKKSLGFVKNALNGNALLRASFLGTALFVTLACILLKSLDITYSLDAKGPPQPLSPRALAVLFLPAEFLIYDLILGNSQPRTTLASLYLDWRWPRLLLEWLKLLIAVALPAAALFLLTGFLWAAIKRILPGGVAMALLTLVSAPVLCVLMLGYVFRFVYLPIVVARRQPKALKTAFGETKGKVWAISRALFLPYLAVAAATLLMELLGPLLERSLGFVGLAPWFLLDALLTGFLGCVTAALLAFSYQRLIGNGAGAEFALDPGEGGTD